MGTLNLDKRSAVKIYSAIIITLSFVMKTALDTFSLKHTTFHFTDKPPRKVNNLREHLVPMKINICCSKRAKVSEVLFNIPCVTALQFLFVHLDEQAWIQKESLALFPEFLPTLHGWASWQCLDPREHPLSVAQSSLVLSSHHTHTVNYQSQMTKSWESQH